MSYVERMRMEMERQHEEYPGYNIYDRAEDEDDMDVLRGLHNNRSMMTSPRNGFYLGASWVHCTLVDLVRSAAFGIGIVVIINI